MKESTATTAEGMESSSSDLTAPLSQTSSPKLLSTGPTLGRTSLSDMPGNEQVTMGISSLDSTDNELQILAGSVTNWYDTVKGANRTSSEAMVTAETAVMSALAIYITRRRAQDLDSIMTLWRYIRNGHTVFPAPATLPAAGFPSSLRPVLETLQACEDSGSEDDQNDDSRLHADSTVRDEEKADDARSDDERITRPDSPCYVSPEG